MHKTRLQQFFTQIGQPGKAAQVDAIWAKRGATVWAALAKKYACLPGVVWRVRC